MAGRDTTGEMLLVTAPRFYLVGLFTGGYASIGSTPGYVPSYGVPRSGLKEITPDLVATCAEIPNFATNKTEMSHGVIE